MDSHLLKTKSIEQLIGDVEHGKKHLKRTLSALDLTLLGIGAIIGTGIFVLTGTAAANQAGPSITMSAAPGSAPGTLVNLPAILIVLLIMILLVRGVRESARANAVMVAIKLA